MVNQKAVTLPYDSSLRFLGQQDSSTAGGISARTGLDTGYLTYTTTVVCFFSKLGRSPYKSSDMKLFYATQQCLVVHRIHSRCICLRDPTWLIGTWLIKRLHCCAAALFRQWCNIYIYRYSRALKKQNASDNLRQRVDLDINKFIDTPLWTMFYDENTEQNNFWKLNTDVSRQPVPCRGAWWGLFVGGVTPEGGGCTTNRK